MESVFTIDISQLVGKDYAPMADDMARFVIIQMVIQTLLFTMDSKQFPIFSADFALLLLFIIAGVMFYWLVFKRLLSFK
jgi:hypothetical protein